jgi:ubiquitin-like 1-activating enzyme E1 B
MWKTRSPPQPLDYETVASRTGDAVNGGGTGEPLDDQRAWSLEESFVVFLSSLHRLSKRMVEMKKSRSGGGSEPTIEFDKDDDDTLDFVAASSNIRSTLFGIDRKSRFDIKQMAGNIIPAIATTNAITAGLCVLEAFRVLRGEYDKVKDVSFWYQLQRSI